MIHGDAKSANIFLRENPDEKDGWEVGLIDFQWMGFGLGAVDAAHVLCASCDPEALGYDETGKIVDERAGSALLDHYYSELITALTTNGPRHQSKRQRQRGQGRKFKINTRPPCWTCARCFWLSVGPSQGITRNAGSQL